MIHVMHCCFLRCVLVMLCTVALLACMCWTVCLGLSRLLDKLTNKSKIVPLNDTLILGALLLCELACVGQFA